jgi:hypothetical protein
MKTTLLLTVLAAILLAAAVALATPYVPLEQITVHQGQTLYTVPPLDATYNHMQEFLQTAGFLQPLQCEDPGANFGGQREEEPGGGYYIIETDNTLEAIQVWSRYHQFTGNAQYDDEIRDAWTYAYAWPAWLEGAGYYSAHNCAWGLAAELQYRTTFGDSAHWNYAVNCANYIIATPLSFASSLNLYLYGEATGNETYKRTAVQRAREIMDWVEIDPANRLSQESWAMSSGTFVWGLCNSIFRYNPALGQQWLATYGPMVQVFEPSPTGWSNAWNVAYCNAQGGIFDVTGNPVYANNHLSLTNTLIHNDQDNDGGIPSSASGSQNADASWTSAYLALMGCDRYLGQGVDAGVMQVRSPRNNSQIMQGVPISVTALLGNWGTQALNNLMVTVSGALQDTLYVNLPAFGNATADFGLWTPTTPGVDSLWVTVHAPGDSNTINDSDKSRFRVRQAAEDAGITLSAARAENQLRLLKSVGQEGSQVRISFTLPAAASVKIALYNIRGQFLRTLGEGFFPVGQHELNADLSALANGVYLARLVSGGRAECVKVVVVK